MHKGLIRRFATMKRALMLSVDPSLFSSIAGSTDSELMFYLALWLPTVVYVLMVKSQAAVDWGAVAASYLGVALFGALFVSLGIFASTLTKNQIIAAVIAVHGILAGITLHVIVATIAVHDIIAALTASRLTDRLAIQPSSAVLAWVNGMGFSPCSRAKSHRIAAETGYVRSNRYSFSMTKSW